MAKVSTPTSPKVTAGALAGGLATVVVGVAGMLGLELPTGVGEATGVLLGAVVVAVAAWAKRDPLRDAGQVALEGGILDDAPGDHG